ncbi:hypothetical protein [Kaistella jeonii]|uniref:General stress protein 17M-like domain-containing protein n=1 Tax=Kaistella jeonii TaxID=266749 RepID=A0A0C1FS39_9FLAO|nr:hypothetical protein [Kaistella jeonii]KIA90729.1 hypothetical protein OA86_02340 [Kaistella jeonii]SFB68600.1 hypothetical protein SAMN05421876_10147 [Kaistella jeonii]VEI94654.1 Uncharacterised protein [Kaistella jeonii]
MAYTIVGMFPTTEDADEASNKLDSAGFEKEDNKVSRYSTTGNYDKTSSNYHYKEDEKTSGFWNWLFGDDDDEKNKYSYAGTKSNLVTVYADDMDRAEKARDIMNDEGAINVNEFTKERYPHAETTAKHDDLSEAQRARIISKAKNNLYLTDDTRFYDATSDGMESDMDPDGSRNTF